jgi:hypothetical protein
MKGEGKGRDGEDTIVCLHVQPLVICNERLLAEATFSGLSRLLILHRSFQTVSMRRPKTRVYSMHQPNSVIRTCSILDVCKSSGGHA